MCLGIPGRIVSLLDAAPDLAEVDVAGVKRRINIALLDRGAVQCGDWILIHAGFAMDKIDAETAALQLAVLQDYTGDPAGEPDPEAEPDGGAERRRGP